LAVLAVIPLVGNLAHRYMIFMQPLYLSCIAGGAVLAARKGAKLLAQGSARREVWATIGAMGPGAALLGVMLLPPLGTLYAGTKKSGAAGLERVGAARFGLHGDGWVSIPARRDGDENLCER